jgi:hypothetical protein
MTEGGQKLLTSLSPGEREWGLFLRNQNDVNEFRNGRVARESCL